MLHFKFLIVNSLDKFSFPDIVCVCVLFFDQ